MLEDRTLDEPAGSEPVHLTRRTPSVVQLLPFVLATVATWPLGVVWLGLGLGVSAPSGVVLGLVVIVAPWVTMWLYTGHKGWAVAGVAIVAISVTTVSVR